MSDRAESGGLLRVVSHWDLTAQGVSIVLASSIFVLPGITYGELGGWAPLAVVAATIGVLFVLLTFGEAAGRYRDPGGPYRYAGDAFGEYAGAQIGIIYWVVRATATASVANVFVAYMAELWPAAAQPGWRAALISAAILGGGWLNYRGTRQTSSVLNVLTLVKVAPLILLCIVGVLQLSPDRFTGSPLPTSSSWARAILLWVFAFGGFEATVIPASEARDPVRDIPRALLYALAIVAGFYIAVQIIVVGILPTPSAVRPVGTVARMLLGDGGAVMIALAAIVVHQRTHSRFDPRLVAHHLCDRGARRPPVRARPRASEVSDSVRLGAAVHARRMDPGDFRQLHLERFHQRRRAIDRVRGDRAQHVEAPACRAVRLRSTPVGAHCHHCVLRMAVRASDTR